MQVLPSSLLANQPDNFVGQEAKGLAGLREHPAGLDTLYSQLRRDFSGQKNLNFDRGLTRPGALHPAAFDLQFSPPSRQQQQAQESQVPADLVMSDIETELRQLQMRIQNFEDAKMISLAPAETQISPSKFNSSVHLDLAGQKPSIVDSAQPLNVRSSDKQIYLNQLVQCGQQTQASKDAKTQQLRLRVKQRKKIQLSIAKIQLAEGELAMPLARENLVQNFAVDASRKWQDFNMMEDTMLSRQAQTKFENNPLKSSIQHTLSAENQIQRALAGKLPTDKYDLRYINSLKIQSSCPRATIIRSFQQHSRQLKLHAESKFFAGNPEVKLLASKLFENEQRMELEDYQFEGAHFQLKQCWSLVIALAEELKVKPDPVDLLVSLKDDRVRDHGKLAKNHLEVRIARVGAGWLEKILRESHQIQNLEHNEVEALRFFEKEAYEMIEQYSQHDYQTYACLQDNLLFDQHQQSYPYVVLMLLFRTGLYEQAISFAAQSQSEDVRSFGKLISCYYKEFKQKLPLEQISEFFASVTSDGYGQKYDICKEALLHLMTGCYLSFAEEQEKLLFLKVLPLLDDQIWFFLKLAGAEFEHVFSDKVSQLCANQLPNQFKPYFLEDLQEKVARLGRDGLTDSNSSIEENAAKRAKIFMLLGQYNLALDGLVEINFLVEAVHFAIALQDLQLVATRHSLLKTLRTNSSQSREVILKHFKSNEELLKLYEKCFNFDGNLLALAFEGANSENFVTEGISLILLGQDENLQQAALANFLHEKNLTEILLESDAARAFLAFEINKEVTLRTLLKEGSYRALVLLCAATVEEAEPNLAICLLDKICEHTRVLELMLRMQSDQNKVQKPETFCSLISEFALTQKQSSSEQLVPSPASMLTTWQPRVKEQFKQILESYKKTGFEKKYPSQYFLLEQGDLVAQAFQILKDEAEVRFEDLLSAYAKLQEVKFIPQFKTRCMDEQTAEAQTCAEAFSNLEGDLQVLTIDTVICISRLAQFSVLQLNRDASQSAAGADKKRVERARDQVIKMRDHQEMLTHYVDTLCSLDGSYQQALGERLTKASEVMRKIQININ